MKKLILIIYLFTTTLLFGQDFKSGETIFNQNCAACHKMDKKVIGPPLQNVVSEQGIEWAYKWVKNNQKLRESGDAHANEIYNQYNGSAMPPYEYLGDKGLKDVVEYLSKWKGNQVVEVPIQANNDSQVVVQSTAQLPHYIKIIIGIALVLLLGILLFLGNVVKTLVQAHSRSKSTETYLLKKQDMTVEELNQEFDKYIDTEVENRIKNRISNLKKDLKNTLKDF